MPRAVQTFLLWRSPLAFLERCRNRYGRRFTIHPTSRPRLVFLSEPDELRAMLSAPADVLHPGEGAETVEPIVGGESFMLHDQAKHLIGRRAILSPLRAQAVNQHADAVAEVTRREVASWPLDTAFALHPRLRSLLLETALRTVSGVSERVEDHELYALRDGLLEMLSVTASAVFPEPLLRQGPGRRTWRRFLGDRASTDALIYRLIDCEHAAEQSSNNVLDKLRCARNGDGSWLSQKQMRDNLMSIVLAGHETTASQLAWAFQLLAHNPSTLEQLIAEIDADVGDEYLTATIQEVLRHRPVFLFAIPRAVKQSIDLGGWIYRPPAQLLGCIYLLHHDPTLYPEPHRFRPERFLEAPPSAHMWVPWGGGRRRCPGLHLAMQEMKIVLRSVLETMTVRPASETIEHPRWRSVIVTPHAGSRVVLQRRKLARR